MKGKRRIKKNIMSKFFVVHDVNSYDPPNDNSEFSTIYNNTLFIEYNTPMTDKNISSIFPKKKICLLPPAKPNSKTLYFCHFPDSISNRGEFEKLIIRFLPIKTLKIKAFIAEKVFSVSFESDDDAIRIATFIPKIYFGKRSDNQESEDEEEEEEEYNDDSNCEHIFVGSSWFEMPIIRFSNIPVDIKQEKFQNQKLLKDTVYCQFQKNKTSNKSKVFQNINVIARSTKQAEEIINFYNFGSFKNEMAYVNWFVDNDVLEQLEKYKIKVFPKGRDDDLSHTCETDFYKEMSNYGRVFSVTLCRSTKGGNENENDDDDNDYDQNDIDENSEDNNAHDNDENKESDSSILFGNVIFVNKDDIKKVKEDFDIEYWFAGGMIYNFPFGTTEKDVGNYLSDFNENIKSIELRNRNKVEEDDKILPYFFITFDSVDSLEDARQYIEKNPYPIKNMNGKMQPFIIPKEKNLPSTIQKYNFHRDLLLKSNTILVENLTDECSSLGLISLFADYGTIMFFKIDKKNTANLTFNDESEMEAAIEGVNEAIYNKVKLRVTQYILPSENNLNASLTNSGKKKKKKKNKNTFEANDGSNNSNNNKIKITKNDNKNISLVINRRNDNQNQKNSNNPNQRNNNPNQRNYNPNQRNNNPNQRNNNSNQRNSNPNQRNNNPNQRNNNPNQRNNNNPNQRINNPKQKNTNENPGRGRRRNENNERRGHGNRPNRGFISNHKNYEAPYVSDDDDDIQNSGNDFDDDDEIISDNDFDDDIDDIEFENF